MDSIQRELLNYLAALPAKIKTADPTEFAYASIQIGNGLVWVSGSLDPRGWIEEPIDTRATSIQSLGRQFQWVGRDLLERAPTIEPGVQNQVNRLRLEVETIRKMVLRGGGK